MRFFRTGGLNRRRYEEEVSEKSDSMRLPMNAKRKTSAMLALLIALGVANVVRGDDFETIRRFPKPTPLPASTARVGTDKDVAHNALHHKFSDMVGKPDRKGSIHFNGHPAEIAALTLDKLGLMNGYPDGTFRPDRTITRAEFAAVVSRAFKFAGSPAAAAFSDPDGPLMETEAVKMVVAALGYADDAAAKGGYPRGYMRVGNEKYISRGLNVHIGEQATRGLAAQIMFYALGSQIRGTGKTLYNMHSGKAGKRIGREFIDAMLQDYYYYREEALEAMMMAGITPLRVFDSMLDVLLKSANKEERIRAIRALSEFMIFDLREHQIGKTDKAYMELVYGRLNLLSAGNMAVIANNPCEDEDVRLYALRALYLLDREDLAEKNSWTIAFKTKAMKVTRHLLNKAQDILEMTDDEASVNALVNALSSSDAEVVLRAIDTLGRKGRNPNLAGRAKAAVPALQKLLDHGNPRIAERACVAIRDLGGKPRKIVTPVLAPYGGSKQDVVTIIDGAEYKYGDPIPSNKVVTISNGNIVLTFDAGDRNSWAGVKKMATFDDDRNLLKGYGFITWNSGAFGRIIEHDGRRSRGLKTANADYAEYAYMYSPTDRFPYSLEVVYRVPRGESGFYLYYTVDKAEGTASCSHLYCAPMFRKSAEVWEYQIEHDKLQFNSRVVEDSRPIDTEYGRKDIYQSVYRNQNGELNAKHERNPYQLDASISGSANDRLGMWILTVSKDSLCKLLKNDNGMFEGEYFTWSERPVPEGRYHKVYGPVMVYFNRGATLMEKYEDAKSKLAFEQARWPYAWVEDAHYFERGSICGKVEMFDGSSPKGAYVVVNVPGETAGKKGERYVTWCQSNSPYQYWTRADENGRWRIDGVHAGAYAVTVWKEGHPGEVAKGNVAVKRALCTDVGTMVFREYANGSLAWRVGDADRTWLYDSEKNFGWELIHYYPMRFPNDVEFKVGESSPKYDWNYVQIKMDTYRATPLPFSIVWNMDEVPAGQPVLTVATCSSRNTGGYGLKVLVNGTLVETLDYSSDDSMVMRTHSYGKLIFNPISFDKSLLKVGANKITLEINSGAISYDFVQLEYKLSP